MLTIPVVNTQSLMTMHMCYYLIMLKLAVLIAPSTLLACNMHAHRDMTAPNVGALMFNASCHPGLLAPYYILATCQ
jgi:hypothetical protein